MWRSVGFVCLLAPGLMGCSEASGTGVCTPGIGAPGAGGGAYYPPQMPGVYSHEVYEVEAIGQRGRVAARFETSSDCTALVPSTDCAIDGDSTEPAFFEIELEGLDDRGGKCSAAVAITAEMVTEVPMQDTGSTLPSFTIEVTDDDGAHWRIDGQFYDWGVQGSARRTDGDAYCKATWFAHEGCKLTPPNHFPCGPYYCAETQYCFFIWQGDATFCDDDGMCGHWPDYYRCDAIPAACESTAGAEALCECVEELYGGLEDCHPVSGNGVTGILVEPLP